MTETFAETIRMQQEIMSGFTWGDPRSKIPQTDENHQMWTQMASEIDELQAAGKIVEIPFELPMD